MVANVHLGDQIDDLLDDWYHVWKMLGKALGAVFSVSTIDVVARYDPALESSFRTQRMAQCIISTAESGSLSVSCTWNGKKDLLFALIQIHHPLWQKKPCRAHITAMTPEMTAFLYFVMFCMFAALSFIQVDLSSWCSKYSA